MAEQVEVRHVVAYADGQGVVMGGNARGKADMGSVGLEQVDRLVRARIAEIMSAAGMGQGRIGLEVLWGLPPGFIRAYEQLWRVCDGSEGEDGAGKNGRRDAEVGVSDDPKNKGGGAGGRLRDTERSRERMGEVVVRSGGSSRRAARGASRGGGAGLSLGPEEALRLKGLIDKRLRALGREIADELRELWGYDVDSGEQRVAVDATRMSSMREALLNGDRRDESI